MRALATTLTLLCALALAVAGCGKSGDERGSDNEQIRDTQAKFEQAIEAKDTEAFCDLLAPSYIEDIGGLDVCLNRYRPANNLFFNADDTDMSVTNIDFEKDGQSATAYLANKGFIYYQKEGGNWYPAPFQRTLGK